MHVFVFVIAIAIAHVHVYVHVCVYVCVYSSNSLANSSSKPRFYIIIVTLQCAAVCCHVLQCVAACCCLLQCVAVCTRSSRTNSSSKPRFNIVNVALQCCSALQCVAVFAVCTSNSRTNFGSKSRFNIINVALNPSYRRVSLGDCLARGSCMCVQWGGRGKKIGGGGGERGFLSQTSTELISSLTHIPKTRPQFTTQKSCAAKKTTTII